MYSLKEILNQASEQSQAVISDQPVGFNVIKRGVKIQKFSDRIEILNTGKGGSYYKECTPIEYSYFYEDGWNVGCVKLGISNCLHKLELIEAKIKNEVNTRKNDKHIKNNTISGRHNKTHQQKQQQQHQQQQPKQQQQ